jgi:hypothetical protein
LLPVSAAVHDHGIEVVLPDGTRIRALSIAERREIDHERDFGLYMDALWKPTWPAELTAWVDRGVPSDPERAAAQITEAFARARAGERVEIGCLGGRGRTGTVLAAMAVLARVAPTEAVRWVREHYDAEAVETREQEEWVLWFATLRGTTRSPAPQASVPHTTA